MQNTPKQFKEEKNQLGETVYVRCCPGLLKLFTEERQRYREGGREGGGGGGTARAHKQMVTLLGNIK